MYEVLKYCRSWNDRVPLSNGARDELLFWKDSVSKFNGQPIWFSPSATRMAYCDANSTGFGGYVMELGKEVSHGLWSEAEGTLSSSWHELKAICNVLVSFTQKLLGHKVKWFRDNQSVRSIVTNSSKEMHLQDGALSIFAICMKYSLRNGFQGALTRKQTLLAVLWTTMIGW